MGYYYYYRAQAVYGCRHKADVDKAKDLLLSGDLDADDYRSIKKETETKIASLLQMLSAMSDPLGDINKLIKKQEKIILNLSFLYQKAGVEQKRRLISLLFPKNLIYTIDVLLSQELGTVIKLIYII